FQLRQFIRSARRLLPRFEPRRVSGQMRTRPTGARIQNEFPCGNPRAAVPLLLVPVGTSKTGGRLPTADYPDKRRSNPLLTSDAGALAGVRSGSQVTEPPIASAALQAREPPAWRIQDQYHDDPDEIHHGQADAIIRRDVVGAEPG